MSYNLASEKAFDFDNHHASQHAEEGQRHDRISFEEQNTGIGNMSAPDTSTTQDEITVTQRMVSATVGSVLTSLLGMPQSV